MDLIEQIKLHKALSLKIEEMEEQKKSLGLSIKEAMQGKTLQIDGFLVRRCSRICIKTTLEEARILNATKLEEAVDKEKIKALYHQGQPIEGVSEIEYIQITSTPLEQVR